MPKFYLTINRYSFVLTSMPEEIVGEVVASVSRSDIKNLSLVSHQIRTHLNFLFSEIVVTDATFQQFMENLDCSPRREDEIT